MAKKAKFICRYYGRGYEKHMVFTEYEYRGHTYTVYENKALGNEPLVTQHKSWQARIDEIIRQQNLTKDPNAESYEVGFEMFWKSVNEE